VSQQEVIKFISGKPAQLSHMAEACKRVGAIEMKMSELVASWVFV